MWIPRKIEKDLEKLQHKIIILYGPRQAGKTSVIEHFLKPDLKINLDTPSHRLRFRNLHDFLVDWYERGYGPFPKKQENKKKKPLVFIDEIHKVRGWRNILKGNYDLTRHALRFVCSGSSAFNLRKQDRGDSLAGRAAWIRLDPPDFAEFFNFHHAKIKLGSWNPHQSLFDAIKKNLPHQKKLRKIWELYSEYGSYPENLTHEDKYLYRQWLEDYLEALLNRDLKDLNVSKDVDRVHQTFSLLLEGLGSTYSMRSLASTLSTSVATIKSDISALKQVLWGFELNAAQTSRSRQIQREKKFYPGDFCLTNYSELLHEGAFFETQVACLLQRFVHQQVELPKDKLQLYYYRDYEKREIDFILKTKNKLRIAIESKRKNKQDNSLSFFTKKFKPEEALLVVEEPGLFSKQGSYWVASIELLASVL